MNYKYYLVFIFLTGGVASCSKSEDSNQQLTSAASQPENYPTVQPDTSLYPAKRTNEVESRGFNPSDACAYLSSISGLSTSEYAENSDMKVHVCFSSYKVLGDENAIPMADNLAYYAYGDENLVRKIQLILNVNQPDNAADTISSFIDAASQLMQNALHSQPPKALLEAIQNGESKQLNFKKYDIQLSRDNFSGSEGYSLKLTIKDPNFSDNN